MELAFDFFDIFNLYMYAYSKSMHIFDVSLFFHLLQLLLTSYCR